MHFHSPPHFPFHKNRCIYSEFLWKAGLAEKGPCTGLLSSEPSWGIPSLFFLHEAIRKNTKVTRKKRTSGSSSISWLGTYVAFPGSLAQKHKRQTAQSKLALKAYLSWLPPILSFVKSSITWIVVERHQLSDQWSQFWNMYTDGYFEKRVSNTALYNYNSLWDKLWRTHNFFFLNLNNLCL